jgi:hypothetical protein
MACPHLVYRAAAADRSFEEERAFCTAIGEFVQPMRADICNDRYDLHHAEYCEIYREHGGDADDGSDG